MSKNNIDELLKKLQEEARPASLFFGLSGDTEDIQYRRFRTHKSFLQRLRRQKERKAKKERKKRRARFLRFRYRGYIFVERQRYYDRLEQSYWWYLKQKYGKSRVLSLEEFDTYVAPHYDKRPRCGASGSEGEAGFLPKDPGLRLARIDTKTRKDFFLDNIQVVRMHDPNNRFVKPGNHDIVWRYPKHVPDSL